MGDQSYLTIVVPNDTDMIAAARRCAMALEPDPGIDPETYDAFSTLCVDEHGNEYGFYGALVEDWVAVSAEQWIHAPEQFRAIVVAYNNERFPDEPDPTLLTTRKFTDNARFSTAYGTSAGLAELGMTIKVQGAHE